MQKERLRDNSENFHINISKSVYTFIYLSMVRNPFIHSFPHLGVSIGSTGGAGVRVTVVTKGLNSRGSLGSTGGAGVRVTVVTKGLNSRGSLGSTGGAGVRVTVVTKGRNRRGSLKMKIFCLISIHRFSRKA